MSNKQTVEIATPITGIEAIGKISRALFVLNKPADYKEVSTMAGLAPAYTSQTLSAAKSLGLSQQSSGRGKYQLTESGEAFARSLGFGKEEDARRIIRNQIMHEGTWSEIVSFLRMNEGNPRDPLDLAYHAESRLGKRWSDSMRSHISTAYRSILEYAGLVRVDDKKIISQIGLDDGAGLPDEAIMDEISPQDSDGIRGLQDLLTRYKSDDIGYAEFSMPDFFILHIKRTKSAIDFLTEQLKEASLLVPWLAALQKSIEAKEVESND